jgi:hypothetical protein
LTATSSADAFTTLRVNIRTLGVCLHTQTGTPGGQTQVALSSLKNVLTARSSSEW